MRAIFLWIAGSILFLAQFLFVCFEYSLLGFPDGHYSELDRFRSVLYPVFLILSPAGSIAGVFGALSELRGRSRRVWLLFSALFCSVAFFFIIDFLAARTFDHGVGG